MNRWRYICPTLVATNGIEYIKEISSFVRCFTQVNGKAFVLFTSYSTLNQIYYNIHHKLLSNGLEVFLHGTKPRSMLVKILKARNQFYLVRLPFGKVLMFKEKI